MILDYTFEKRLEYTARDEHEAGKEEGILEQSVQTEMERKRAEEAEKRAEEAEKRAEAAEKKVRILQELLDEKEKE